MEDEKGMDEKILCVLEEDYCQIQDIDDFSKSVKDDIYWFFSNYKTKTQHKWSNVMGFDNKSMAIQLIQNCTL